MRKFLIKEVTGEDWLKADMPVDRCSDVITEDELIDRLLQLFNVAKPLTFIRSGKFLDILTAPAPQPEKKPTIDGGPDRRYRQWVDEMPLDAWSESWGLRMQDWFKRQPRG